MALSIGGAEIEDDCQTRVYLQGNIRISTLICGLFYISAWSPVRARYLPLNRSYRASSSRSIQVPFLRLQHMSGMEGRHSGSSGAVEYIFTRSRMSRQGIERITSTAPKAAMHQGSDKQLKPAVSRVALLMPSTKFADRRRVSSLAGPEFCRTWASSGVRTARLEVLHHIVPPSHTSSSTIVWV